MVDVDTKLSRKIANMGFVSACLVVLIHCPKEPGGMVDFFHHVFPGCFTYIPNAFFFMVAGFFLCGKYETARQSFLETYCVEIKKRFFSLVIPYFVLNMIWFGCMTLYRMSSFRVSASVGGVGALDVLRGLGIYGIENPADGPLWFVRSLFLYVCIFPLFYPFVRRGRPVCVLGLVLLGMNCLSWSHVANEVVMWIFRPQWLLFFLGGAALRIYGIPAISKKMGGVCLVAGLAMILLLEYASFPSAFNTVLLWINRPFMIAGLWAFIPDTAWPKVLVGNAFPIYVLHWPLIEISSVLSARSGVYGLVFGNVLHSSLFVLVVIGIVIAEAAVIRRSIFLERMVFGGR